MPGVQCHISAKPLATSTAEDEVRLIPSEFAVGIRIRAECELKGVCGRRLEVKVDAKRPRFVKIRGKDKVRRNLGVVIWALWQLRDGEADRGESAARRHRKRNGGERREQGYKSVIHRCNSNIIAFILHLALEVGVKDDNLESYIGDRAATNGDAASSRVIVSSILTRDYTDRLR